MPTIYTAETLLDSIRTLAGIPNVESQGTATADLLKAVNLSLLAKIVPELIKVKEEYLVQRTRIPLAGINRVRLPSRAVANKLRDIMHTDANGDRHFLGTAPIQMSDLDHYNGSGSGQPDGWFIEGNVIQLVPTTGSYTGYLELAYFCHPASLVLSTATRKVTARDLVTKVVTLDSAIPSSWNLLSTFDVHSMFSGAEIHIMDASAIQVGALPVHVPPYPTNQITFTDAIDGSAFGTWPVEVGDYVALAGESALVQIPDDLLPALIEDVALRVSVGNRDTEKTKMHYARMKDQLEASMGLFKDRVEGKPYKITGRHAIRGRGF